MHQQWDPVNEGIDGENDPLLQQALNEAAAGEEVAAANANFIPVQAAAIEIVQLLNAPQPYYALNGGHIQCIEDSFSSDGSLQPGNDNVFIPGVNLHAHHNGHQLGSHVLTSSSDSSSTYSSASVVGNGQSASNTATGDAAEVHVIPPAAAPLLPIKEDDMEGDINQALQVSCMSELSDLTASNDAPSEKLELGGSEEGNNPPQEPDTAGDVMQVQPEREASREERNYKKGILVKFVCIIIALSTILIIIILLFQGYSSDIFLLIAFGLIIVIIVLVLALFMSAWKVYDRNYPGRIARSTRLAEALT